MVEEKGARSEDRESRIPTAVPLIAASRPDFTPHKTIRIACTGDVLLNALEVKIVDTEAFQRLRGIKQLGPTYLVYPTALHTRFDHSLGTFEMAKEMIHAIRGNKHNSAEEKAISDEDEQIARVYALLHDITHIPFGHTLEDEFCLFPRHDQGSDRLDHFVGPKTKIGRTLLDHLGGDGYDRIRNLFETTTKLSHVANTQGDVVEELLKDDAFIYDIVNNTICADLLDYLRRDCHFCGIVAGMDYRFVRFLYLAPSKQQHVRRLAVRLWKAGKPWPKRDLLTEMLRLLDNRYLLAERVYFHHAKLIAGAMIAAAVQRAAMTEKDLYDLSDDVLLHRLAASNDDIVKGIIGALRCRKLWKEIAIRSRSEIQADQDVDKSTDVWERVDQEFHSDRKSRLRWERQVSQYLGFNDTDFLIYCPPRKMAFKPADMKVFWNGKLQCLRACTDDSAIEARLHALLSAHENLWALRAFLNPDQVDRETEARVASEYVFSLGHPARESVATRFMEIGVRRAVAEGYGTADYARAEQVIKDVVTGAVKGAQHGGIPGFDTVRTMVRDAFEIQGNARET